jgi:hypothetical protein
MDGLKLCLAPVLESGSRRLAFPAPGSRRASVPFLRPPAPDVLERGEEPDRPFAWTPPECVDLQARGLHAIETFLTSTGLSLPCLWLGRPPARLSD